MNYTPKIGDVWSLSNANSFEYFTIESIVNDMINVRSSRDRSIYHWNSHSFSWLSHAKLSNWKLLTPEEIIILLVNSA